MRSTSRFALRERFMEPIDGSHFQDRF